MADRWTEWGTVLSGIGVAISIVGFKYTLDQVKKTKSAAESAKSAAIEMKSSMSKSYLLILLPQLNRLADDLASAARRQEFNLISLHIQQWRWSSGQLSGLIDLKDKESEQVRNLIHKSISKGIKVRFTKTVDGSEIIENLDPYLDAVQQVTAQFGKLSISESRGKVE